MRRVLLTAILLCLLLIPAHPARAQVAYPTGTAAIEIQNIFGGWIMRVTDTTTGTIVGNWSLYPGRTVYLLAFRVVALHNYQITMLRLAGQPCRTRAKLAGYWNFIPQGDRRQYNSIVSPTVVTGDVNFDGVINVLDLSAVSGVYGLCQGQPGYVECYDLDFNTCISIGDMTIISSNFNKREPHWYGYISVHPGVG